MYQSVFDIPGDIDLAIVLTGKAVDTFEAVLQRKAKFAVIFAAGSSETGKVGDGLYERNGFRLSDVASGYDRLDPARPSARTGTGCSASSCPRRCRYDRGHADGP